MRCSARNPYKSQRFIQPSWVRRELKTYCIQKITKMPSCDCLLNPDNPSQDPARNNYLDWPDPNIGTPADITLPYPPYQPQNPDTRQPCPMSASRLYYCDMPMCTRRVCNNCAVRNFRNL